jgi:DNA-binding CsgD family transcriptional regulator
MTSDGLERWQAVDEQIRANPELLLRLTWRQREVVIRVRGFQDFEGRKMRPSEVARELNIARNSVSERLNCALSKLEAASAKPGSTIANWAPWRERLEHNPNLLDVLSHRQRQVVVRTCGLEEYAGHPTPPEDTARQLGFGSISLVYFHLGCARKKLEKALRGEKVVNYCRRSIEHWRTLAKRITEHPSVLDFLAPRQRQLIIMACGLEAVKDPVAPRDIAHVLGLGISAVYTQLSRAERKLEVALRGQSDAKVDA